MERQAPQATAAHRRQQVRSWEWLPVVTLRPCLDVGPQPEDGLTLLDSRLREVGVALSVDAHAVRVGDADELGHLVVVDEVGGIDPRVGIARHAERVVDNSNTSSSVEVANSTLKVAPAVLTHPGARPDGGNPS
jgi:hypothetical protein